MFSWKNWKPTEWHLPGLWTLQAETMRQVWGGGRALTFTTPDCWSFLTHHSTVVSSACDILPGALSAMALCDSTLPLIFPETTKRCQPLKALKIELSDENKHLFNKSLSRRQRALSGWGVGNAGGSFKSNSGLVFWQGTLSLNPAIMPQKGAMLGQAEQSWIDEMWIENRHWKWQAGSTLQDLICPVVLGLQNHYCLCT